MTYGIIMTSFFQHFVVTARSSQWKSVLTFLSAVRTALTQHVPSLTEGRLISAGAVAHCCTHCLWQREGSLLHVLSLTEGRVISAGAVAHCCMYRLWQREGSLLQEQQPTAACTVSDRGKGHCCMYRLWQREGSLLHVLSLTKGRVAAACTVSDRGKGHCCMYCLWQREGSLLHVLSLTEGHFCRSSTPLLHALSLTEGRVISAGAVAHSCIHCLWQKGHFSRSTPLMHVHTTWKRARNPLPTLSKLMWELNHTWFSCVHCALLKNKHQTKLIIALSLSHIHTQSHTHDTHTHIYIYTCTHTHTHMHAHTHSCAFNTYSLSLKLLCCLAVWNVYSNNLIKITWTVVELSLSQMPMKLPSK